MKTDGEQLGAGHSVGQQARATKDASQQQRQVLHHCAGTPGVFGYGHGAESPMHCRLGHISGIVVENGEDFLEGRPGLGILIPALLQQRLESRIPIARQDGPVTVQRCHAHGGDAILVGPRRVAIEHVEEDHGE
eukprot:CAMPEP_0198133700 /NCGR_PEP_ID=MMETSP1442-20131203/59704_1 /TAXON_ID= /ORGANISM="Craspedostauros australis, Strain CCMP3328" /LENGTH=133 /DNA_ID=CAMNT_0043794831 /DNA_START=320 /DNA_END=721 /DNA_ORIENTATION=-